MADFLGEIASGLRRLQSIKKDMDDLAFREEVLAQKSLLLDAKAEILELRENISALNESLELAKRISDKRSSLLEVEGFKYVEEDGMPKGLPYCPNCEVRENGKLYRLNRANEYYSNCPNCKTGYEVGKDGRVHVDRPKQPFKPRKLF